jgi:hypothetical protein
MTSAGVPAHQKRRSVVLGKFAKAFKKRYGDEGKDGEPKKPLADKPIGQMEPRKPMPRRFQKARSA